MVAPMDLEVYVPPLPASMPELKLRIRTAIETITADMLQFGTNSIIVLIGPRERNQQDATNLMFIIKLISQHVSGIIMPIIRRTRPCTTAYGVLHWLCCLWLCSWVSSCMHCVKVTVQTVTFTQCTEFTTQLHTTTASTTRSPYAVVHSLVLLMMGIMMSETC